LARNRVRKRPMTSDLLTFLAMILSLAEHASSSPVSPDIHLGEPTPIASPLHKTLSLPQSFRSMPAAVPCAWFNHSSSRALPAQAHAAHALATAASTAGLQAQGLERVGLLAFAGLFWDSTCVVVLVWGGALVHEGQHRELGYEHRCGSLSRFQLLGHRRFRDGESRHLP